MSGQQINLHQPIFRKQRALFSARIVLRICAIWALALGIVYALGLWKEGVLSRERDGLVQTRDTSLARLDQLTQQSSTQSRSQQLQDELSLLQDQLTQKEGVLRVLSSGELGSPAGFAPQLDALADRRVAGVWLTRIVLDEGGRDISLHGLASREDLVPAFLERLAGESGFPGARFGDLRLSRAEDTEQLSFELHTRPGAELP